MCPAALFREQHLRAQDLLGAGALDEQLDDLDRGAGEVRGENDAQRRAQHVARPAQEHGARHQCREQQDDVVPRVRVECLVEPLGPVAEPVHGQEERVVERLEERQRQAEGRWRRAPARRGVAPNRAAPPAHPRRCPCRRSPPGPPRAPWPHAPCRRAAGIRSARLRRSSGSRPSAPGGRMPEAPADACSRPRIHPPAAAPPGAPPCGTGACRSACRGSRPARSPRAAGWRRGWPAGGRTASSGVRGDGR